MSRLVGRNKHPADLRGLNTPLINAEFSTVKAKFKNKFREDLRALEHRGLAGAVLGMALYTGALDARRIAEEFGA